jgi:hypothetical protein
MAGIDHPLTRRNARSRSLCLRLAHVNNALQPAPAVAWGMTYKNLTPEKLAKHRIDKPLNDDGTWPDWPHPIEPKKKKKKRVRGGKTARGKISKAFKPGGGRLS